MVDFYETQADGSTYKSMDAKVFWIQSNFQSAQRSIKRPAEQGCELIDIFEVDGVVKDPPIQSQTFQPSQIEQRPRKRRTG